MIESSVDLRTLVREVERQGELRRIAVAVDPYLEIAALTDRVSKAHGPALWFEQARGFSLPVVTNLFGSPQRAAQAVGGEKALARLQGLLASACGDTAAKRLQGLLAGISFDEAVPRWREAAADLADLPALQAWPGDAGRYLTLPVIVTRDPDSGSVNWGMYRVQLCGRRSALIAWKEGSGAAQHWAAWQRQHRPMPVAIVLGAPPLLQWAASAPFPAGLDEAALAGLIAGTPLALSRCESCDLPVPAAAEAVIEGVVHPGAVGVEGPFGNHTGGYAPPASAPRLELTVMHRRRDMFYPCTVVGPPPMEDCYLAQQTARLFLPLLQCDLPQIVDLAMPLEGIFHGCAVVAVRGADDRRELCAALRRTPLLRGARLLVLVDGETPVHDPARIFWVVLNRVEPARDLFVAGGGVDVDARHGATAALVLAPQTRELLRRRGGEYGLPEQWLS